MKRLGLTVVKNALANVVRGGASAVVALALPHFLTRDLSVDQFAAWVLMLQIAAYSNYLDFGLQTAVARFVAQAVERRDDALRDRVISTAFGFLLAAALLALLVASVAIWNMQRIFHHAPIHLIGELQGGSLLLCASAALMLPLSTFTGILVGLHRNEYPAMAIGGTRLLGAVGVLILVRHTHSLVWFALCIGGFNVFGGLLQAVVCRRLLPTMRMRFREITASIIRELLHYCAGLTAFNVGMLLVNGMDLILVGYFAFAAAGYYAVAATIIGFMSGLSGAVYSALMAPMAVLQERKELTRIRTLVLDSSRVGSYVSVVLVLAVYLSGQHLLRLWVGPSYATQALPILEILMWAQAIRLTGSAYSVALIATAQQNYGIGAALAEGVVNLVTSVIGAHFLGPIGVAWGTFIGAICGVLCLELYVMRRVKEVPVHALAFNREALLRPVFCFLPLLLYVAWKANRPIALPYLGTSLLLTALLLLWIGGLPRVSVRTHIA